MSVGDGEATVLAGMWWKGKLHSIDESFLGIQESWTHDLTEGVDVLQGTGETGWLLEQRPEGGIVETDCELKGRICPWSQEGSLLSQKRRRWGWSWCSPWNERQKQAQKDTEKFWYLPHRWWEAAGRLWFCVWVCTLRHSLHLQSLAVFTHYLHLHNVSIWWEVKWFYVISNEQDGPKRLRDLLELTFLITREARIQSQVFKFQVPCASVYQDTFKVGSGWLWKL